MKPQLNDEQKQKIWDELFEEGKDKAKSLVQLQTNEKTILMIMDETGLSLDQVRRLMDKKIREGKFTKRIVRIDGHRFVAFKPIEHP